MGLVDYFFAFDDVYAVGEGGDGVGALVEMEYVDKAAVDSIYFHVTFNRGIYGKYAALADDAQFGVVVDLIDAGGYVGVCVDVDIEYTSLCGRCFDIDIEGRYFGRGRSLFGVVSCRRCGRGCECRAVAVEREGGRGIERAVSE